MAATAVAGEKEEHDAGGESAEISQSVMSFMAPRQAPGEAVAPGAYPAARQYAAGVASVDSTKWTELGPYAYFPDNHDYISEPFSNSGSGSGFNTGRITGVAVAPDGSVFAGGAGGGVWRSTDAAHQSWTPLWDAQSTMAVGTLAVVPKGSGYTVYAGTGEPTINLDSYAGVGVLASTDKGASWHRIGGSELQGAGIFKIVATSDGGTLYAATSHGLYKHTGADTNAWKQVIGDPDTGSLPNAQVLNLISDVAIRPGTNNQEIVAWRGWRAGAPTNGLWVSKDGGATFSGPLKPQGFAPPKSLGRGTVAYSADGKKLYVMIQDAQTFNSGAGQTLLQGIYESDRDVSGPFNQIASADKLASSGSAQKPGEIGTFYKPGVQAWYNQFLVVDPANAKHVYAGLEEVYETTDGGTSWVAAAPYWNLTLACFDLLAPDFGGCPNTTHSDQHAATVDASRNTLWVGNDGGVFSRSTRVSTAGGGWTDHNRNLGTLQYYYADSGQASPTSPTVFWGGLQDNGTSKLIPGASLYAPAESSQPFGGDGGATVVDHANPNNVITEYTDLDPAVTTDGGRNWTDVAPGDPSPLFIAPIFADGVTRTSIYAGGEFLWNSTKGAKTTSADWTKLADTGAGHSISAIDVRGGRGYAAWCGPCWPGYVSEDGFQRGMIANTGSGWKPLTLPANFPVRYITGIAVDPSVSSGKTAYVTVGGYARHWQVGPTDPGTGHVFKTTDGGATWTDVSGSGAGALVDAPANDVAVVAGHLVVATDVGVYTSPTTAGGTWKRVGTGLPNVITVDLSVTPDGRILAATHGRGLWIISPDALS
jgi:photosystem II stability/assembly factor-like uncharacterized protein